MVASGGSVTLDPPWPAFVPMTTHLTNIPSDVREAYANLHPVYIHFTGTPLVGGAPSNGMLSMTSSVPNAATTIVETELRHAGAGDAQWQIIDQRLDGTGGVYALDVGAQKLPWLGVPVLNPLTGKVSLAATGSGAGDFVRVDVGYQRTVGQTTTTYFWNVVAPEPADFVLPKVSAVVGDVYPKSGDVVDYGYAALIDSNDLAGYDSARAHAFETFSAWYAGRPPTTTFVRVSVADSTRQ